MVTKDKINNIYKGVIDNKVLTTKLLKECGFNSKDINKLLEDNVIEREKRGIYSFKDFVGLNEYGKKLVALKDYNKGNICFLKCFEKNPNDMDLAFRVLLASINCGDYKKAIDICNIISKSENDYYVADSNYYMYLLSFLTDVPVNDENYMKYLNYCEIKLDPSNNSRNNVYNHIRSLSLNMKFSVALHHFNDYIIKKGKYSIQDLITKSLLVNVVAKERDFKKELNRYVTDKEYDTVMDLLNKRGKKHISSKIDNYIYRLVKIYQKISKTGNVPLKKDINSTNSLEAIDAYDFERALELDKKFYEEKDLPVENNILGIILKDICTLIDSIEHGNKTNHKISKNEKKQIKSKYDDSDIFSQIINHLMTDELDEAFNKLKVYMKMIDKSEYEYLIINLIKISLLDKDLAFVEPMAELSLMNSNDYTANVSKYLQKFYINVSKNDLDKAKIYLDIINKSNKIGVSSFNVDVLSKVINKNNSFDVVTVVEDQEHSKEAKKDSIINEDIVEKAISKTNKSKVVSNDYLDKDKIMIDKKYDDLCENKGIILLKRMDTHRIENILKTANRYPNMTAFTVKDFGEERVVLKYQPVICDDINLSETINEAKLLFKNGKYEECIKKNMQILEYLKDPKGINYAIIGLCHSKLHNDSMAIDYLTVANSVAKKKNEPYDYSELILCLRNEINAVDRKSQRVKVSEKEFINNCNNNYYGINNFEEINSHVCDSGLDVESACSNLGLSADDINIINLIYAKEFFLLGNNEKGELFLNYVIRKKDKSKKVMKIIDEITRNKSLYKSKTDNSIQLSYKLIPKKKN